MKKVAISFVLTISLFSCNRFTISGPTSLKQVSTLLSSLNSNSTVQQVSSVFTLLDVNKDNAISTTEAIGSIEENFSVLDTDNNASINLTELQGILKLLK